MAASLASNEASAIGMEYESDEQINATVNNTRINVITFLALNSMTPC